jgi:uncharacterized protein (TIGR02246 family)
MVDNQNDEAAIRSLVETWMRASQAGDTETVLGLMTDDVVFLVPGQPPFGKEAFKAASQGQQNFAIAGKSDIQEIQLLGDWAYLRNRLEITLTPKDGGPAVKRAGHTLTILQKQADGKWRLKRDANLLTLVT